MQSNPASDIVQTDEIRFVVKHRHQFLGLNKRCALFQLVIFEEATNRFIPFKRRFHASVLPHSLSIMQTCRKNKSCGTMRVATIALPT